MTHSAQANSRSRNDHSLANFDYAFNGVLDPAQVHEIATAAFVGRGENLLLVGGAGTGKTVIAYKVLEEASKLGLSSQYLSSPCFDSIPYLMRSRPEDRSAWGMCLTRAESLSLPQQMKLLGIDFTLPESAGWETTAAAPIERLHSPFAKAPVWHTLYTGENSYRDVLRRRYA